LFQLQIMNHPVAGVDGTDGNHPRYTTVVNNIAREVGLYEKQSSFFVEAKTAQSIILGNVFFNGPRAGTVSRPVCPSICVLQTCAHDFAHCFDVLFA
jgi:hypothetical protein